MFPDPTRSAGPKAPDAGTVTEDLRQSERTRAARPRPVLLIAYGPELGRLGERWVVPAQEVVLGRDEPAFEGGPLADRRISSQHVRVRREGTALMLRDEGSKNGTFVHGRRVEEAELEPGEFLQLGRTFLQYRVEPPFDWRAPGSLLRGASEAMHRLRGEVRAAAQHTRPALILGPSGAGKEPTAREIHRLSGRRGAFVPVNCGALPAELIESELFGHAAGAFTGATRARRGLFEAAERGTLFLDEIGELPLELQPKLLRAIQEGAVRPVGEPREVAVDCRVLAATHRDPVALVQQEALRHDLYARLSGAVVRVPPLDAHLEDIGLLAHAALERAGAGHLTLSAELTWALLEHPWVLNVRALEHVITASAASAGADGVIPLTDAARALLDEQRRLAQTAGGSLAGGAEAPGERRHAPADDVLRELLAKHGGIVARAAKELGVHRYQLYRWLAAAGLAAEEFRRS